MKDYCKKCPHKGIPRRLKESYNIYIKETFSECPMNDKKVIHCTIKDIDIEWKKFAVWLTDSDILALTEVEKKKISK